MIPRFRVWQKYHKKMLKVKEIEFNKDVNIEAITVWNSPNTIPFTNTYIKDTDFDIEALVLMQSTGLFDKNGVDIFEGDVLGGIYDESYINYCDVCKQFTLHDNFGGNDYCYQCEGDVFWHELANDKNLEVIGNVHETPELVEVEE